MTISVRCSVLPHVGRGPVALLVPIHAPHLLAAALVQGQEVRLLFVVIDQVQPVAMQHGRGGGAPAGPHGVRRQRLRPHRAAFHVEAEHAHVPEAGVHPLAVRDRRLRGVAVLGVDRTRRRRLMHQPFPEHFAGEQVQAQHFPLVFRGGRLRALAAAIKSFLRQLRIVLAHHGRKEHAVAPGNGRRPAPSRNRRLPGDVLRGGPAIRQVGVGRTSPASPARGTAARRHPTPTWPRGLARRAVSPRSSKWHGSFSCCWHPGFSWWGT